MRAITTTVLPPLLTTLPLAALIGGEPSSASPRSAWQLIESPSGVYNALAGMAALSAAQ